ARLTVSRKLKKCLITCYKITDFCYLRNISRWYTFKRETGTLFSYYIHAEDGERVYGIIGAVIGDIVGSGHEFKKKIPKYSCKLFCADSTFTDDSVLTIAIADALLHEKPFVDSLWEWAHRYPYAGWGKRFRKWLKGSKDVQLSSIGNGCGMRISPVGFYANSLEETLKIAKEATIPTHNSKEGIKGAQAIASSVYLARQRKSKAEIKAYIEEQFGYNLDMTQEEIVDMVEHFGKGDGELAENSINVAIIAFLNGDDYEGVVRTALTYGGDSDTIACMAGSIAAAYYGVPLSMAKEAVRYLSDDLLAVINEFDHTTFESMHITPPVTKEWHQDCIIVYGKSVVDGINNEDGGYEVFRKRRKGGYPIRTIGVDFSETKNDVKEFISYVEEHPDKTFLVKKVGLGKNAKIGVEKMAPLFAPLKDKPNVYLPAAFLK
ncbi:MAG: ADP-ribosylglycohydrolase family protein, partial [Bacteroidales bacterium]|nr:ADP-ribosylglycohydrolase family protein [Bacteroidales bacterium]